MKIYLITYSFLHSTGSSSAQATSEHVEIPDSGITWKLVKQYNEYYKGENISIEEIARSFQIGTVVNAEENAQKIAVKTEEVNYNRSDYSLWVIIIPIIGLIVLAAIVKTKRGGSSGSYSRNSYSQSSDSDSYSSGYRDAVEDQDRKREEFYERKEQERAENRERQREQKGSGNIEKAFTDSLSDSADFANDFFGVGKKRHRK
jgi:hypothetical protein